MFSSPRNDTDKTSTLEIPHADVHVDAMVKDVHQLTELTSRGDEPVESAPGTPRPHIRSNTPPPKVHQMTPPALMRRAPPPLLKALRENSVEKVCSVLQNNAGAASEPFWDHRAELPLRAAIRMKCNAQIVRLLLEHGASVEEVGGSGLTAVDMLNRSNTSNAQHGGLVSPFGKQGMAPLCVSEPPPFFAYTPPQVYPRPFSGAPLVLQGTGASFDEVLQVLESRAAKETN
jgi:hypothetical protein